MLSAIIELYQRQYLILPVERAGEVAIVYDQVLTVRNRNSRLGRTRGFFQHVIEPFHLEPLNVKRFLLVRLANFVKYVIITSALVL